MCGEVGAPSPTPDRMPPVSQTRELFDMPAPMSQDVSPAVLVSRGAFVIVKLHAHGGLGQVSLATDQNLGRQVALKQIRPELVDDSRSRLRFIGEAEITGQLEHPGIVPIYAIGHDAEQRPFYAMKFVHGRTLAQAIAEYHARPEQATLRQLLTRFVSVCQAIAYAHSRGIIHRDLKPANIMLGEYGETLILDWGLAKRIGVESDQPAEDARCEAVAVTRAGAVVGTPAYMPPEQASGDAATHGPAADIYALGAILYQILTGQAPHTGSSDSEVLSHVREAQPATPSALRRGIAPALEAICMKAMASRPEDRYCAADELANEVENWLADEPVRAHRDSWLARAARWARRHRPIVAGAAALVMTGLAALAISNVLIARQKARAEKSEARALDEALNAKLRLSESLVAQGDALSLTLHPDPARSRYEQARHLCLELGVPADAAELGLSELYAKNRPPLMVLDQLGLRELASVAFCPDGRRALIGGQAEGRGAFKLIDLPTRRVLKTFGPHGGRVLCLAITKKGQQVISGSDDGTLKSWQLKTGACLKTSSGHQGPVMAALIAGGKTLVSSSQDGTLRTWNLATAEPVKVLTGHEGPVLGLAQDAKARVIVSLGVDRMIRQWDISNGRVIRTIGPIDSACSSVAVSHDGEQVVAGGDDGQVRVWKLDSGQLLRLLQHGGLVRAVACSEDGSILSASSDQHVAIWHGATGTLLQVSTGHTKPAVAVCFAPDGWMALSIARDDTIRLWDAGLQNETRRWGGPPYLGLLKISPQPILSRKVCLSADGRLALDGSNYDVTVLDSATFRVIRRLRAPWEPEKAPASRPATSTALPQSRPSPAVTGAGFRPSEFDAAVRDVIRPVVGLALSPDGATVAAVRYGLPIHAWDLQTGKFRAFDPAPGTLMTLAWSPDGRFLLAGDMRGMLNLFDAASGKLLRQFGDAAGAIHCAAFGPDSRQAVAAGERGYLKMWDVGTGQAIRSFEGHAGAVHAAVILLKSGRVLSGGADSTLRLWEPSTGRQLRTFGGHNAAVLSVSGRADERIAVSGSADHSTRFWELDSGRELHVFEGHTGPVRHVALSRGGDHVFTGGDDGSILWDLSRPARYRQFDHTLEEALTKLSKGDDPAALALVGEWYAFRGAGNWAIALLEQARAAGATVSPLTLARCHWRNNNFDAAYPEFKKALELKEAPEAYLKHCIEAVTPFSEPIWRSD